MGASGLKYNKPYDDSYKVLSSYLIFNLSAADLERALVDDEFIRQRLIKEVRTADYSGPFVDCIFSELAHGEKRMRLMQALDTLANFYFSELDLNRLRQELIAEGKDLHIFQEE